MALFIHLSIVHLPRGSQTELTMFVGAGTYVTSCPDWLRKVEANVPVNRKREPGNRQREPATSKFLNSLIEAKFGQKIEAHHGPISAVRKEARCFWKCMFLKLEGGDAYVRGSGCTRDVRAMYAAIKSDVRAMYAEIKSDVRADIVRI